MDPDAHDRDGTAALSRCRGGGVVCPYCAAERQSDARCRSCGGHLDAASLTRSQRDMGPWQVHGRATPGASLATLLALVAAGKVGPESIVRGPGTRWCWRYAADVPELAARFGFCHACRAAVSPDDAECPACSSALPGPDRPPPARAAQPPRRRPVARIAAAALLLGVLLGVGLGAVVLPRPAAVPVRATAAAPPADEPALREPAPAVSPAPEAPDAPPPPATPDETRRLADALLRGEGIPDGLDGVLRLHAQRLIAADQAAEPFRLIP